MINFTSISAKNFLSIGNEPIEITFHKGLNVITGKNTDKCNEAGIPRSNGSGKSTALESIYFALFGKTIRGSNKTDVVNKKTKKGTEIVLEFAKGADTYKIVRKLKPSELAFIKNEKNISRDSILNTQDDINLVLGASEDVFKNCVIMGINQTIPFMAQSKVEKRKFIEGIFDMGIFSEMLKDARKDYNEVLKTLTHLQSQESEKTRNYEIYKEQSAKFETSKQSRIDAIKLSIVDEHKRKETLESKINDIKYDEQVQVLVDERVKWVDAKTNNVTPKKESYTAKFAELRAEIRLLNQQIESAFTTGVCPTCKRQMTEDDTANTESHINQLRDKVKALTIETDDITSKLDNIKQTISKIDDRISTIDDEVAILKDNIRNNEIIINKIADCTANIARQFETAKTIKDEVNNLDDVIAKVDTELKTLAESIEFNIVESEILDQAKFILGENGVKSYIITKLLGIFNKKINKYLQKLNANCTLTFDEFFDETIINDKNQTCSYFNFSSGERRNIDMAIMFSFMDLQKLQGKFDTSLICFDELLDGCLDADGVGFILDILLDKCNDEDKSIYLVTHRKEASNFATGEVVLIQKQNGVSKRINN